MKTSSHSLAVALSALVPTVRMLLFDARHDFWGFMTIPPSSVRPEHWFVKDVSSAKDPEVIGWWRLFSPPLLEVSPIGAAFSYVPL